MHIGKEMCGYIYIISMIWISSFSRSAGLAVNWPGTKEALRGEDVVVETKSGSLRGKRQDWDPRSGGAIKQVDAFLGIPFAEPPVGKLRFKPPVPISRWSGVRNATRFGSVCPQRDVYDQIPAAEDCLTLNIFAPYKVDRQGSWPVMVYIHGGSYRVGTGASYPGKPLAQRGVIVVTINYRLCILGFISARNELLPGNNGLLDQIESLKWVNQNIAAFGGDPHRVTIFGNSAGGASVGILNVSPPARGLFQQSIVQSGSPFSFWAIHNDTVDLMKHTRQVAALFKCSQESFSELVECLREVSVEDLAHCTSSNIPTISVSNTNFRPHVDDYVLPRNIHELYRTGHINPDRVMTGIVEREWSRHIGMMIHDLWSKKGFDNNMDDGLIRSSFEDAIRDIFERQFGWGQSVSNVVLHEYTNWSHVQDPVENRERYITFMTDFGMLAPTVQLAKGLNQRNVPVYTYRFNHRSTKDSRDWYSNAHLMELYYIFGAPFVGYDVVHGYTKDFSETDQSMSEYMMAVWSDFAKTGDPTSSTESTAKWTPFMKETTDYFAINESEKAMMTHMNPDSVSFWNELIPSLRQTIRMQAVTSPFGMASTSVTWFLLALCVILALVIACLAVIMYRARTNRRSQHTPVVL